MKVRVSFTIDIDPEAWDTNFGTGREAKAVRADVQTYVENGARDLLRDLGLLQEQGR
jgi:hypothetical protein